MLGVITSESNPLVKRVRKLHTRKGREKYGEFFVEGIRGVEQLLENGAAIRTVIYSEEVCGINGGEDLLSRLRENGTDVCRVDGSLFGKMTDTVTPQFILALVGIKDYILSDILSKETLMLVIVDGIQDPGNLGTIIRTADAAGADGVILFKGTADPYSPKCVRSTMGSISGIPVFTGNSVEDTFKVLESGGVKIIAASTDGDMPYYREDFRGKTAIVIGSEAAGISPGVREYADRFARIPMRGKAESLNAAVACGIILYKAVEQRLT